MSTVNVEKVLSEISIPMSMEINGLENIKTKEDAENFFEKMVENETKPENRAMLNKAVKLIFYIGAHNEVALNKMWIQNEKLFFEVLFDSIGTLVSLSYDFLTI